MAPCVCVSVVIRIAVNGPCVYVSVVIRIAVNGPCALISVVIRMSFIELNLMSGLVVNANN